MPQHFAHPDNICTFADQLRCECVSDIVQGAGFDAGLLEWNLRNNPSIGCIIYFTGACLLAIVIRCVKLYNLYLKFFSKLYELHCKHCLVTSIESLLLLTIF
jgi:hypothetical protein